MRGPRGGVPCDGCGQAAIGQLDSSEGARLLECGALGLGWWAAFPFATSTEISSSRGVSLQVTVEPCDDVGEDLVLLGFVLGFV